MADITKVYLITGFLGSGKTTFLNRVIQTFPTDRKLMILMNEFGEVGVDGSLIQGDEDLDVLEISKGSIFCVCVKTDFIKSLHAIGNQYQPDVLLMESTGVANPSDLKRDLELPFFNGRFQLTEQFCLLDAANFADAFEVFASVEKQIASSTLFLINKTDLATAEQIRRVKELVALHHPAPRFFETRYAELPVQPFFFPDAAAEDSQPAPAAGAGPALTEAELEEAIDQLLEDPNREVTPPDRLLSTVYAWHGADRAAFEAFAGRLPRSIVRAKGFLTTPQGTCLFSWVMGRWTLEQAEPPARGDRLNQLVFIASPEAMAELKALGETVPEVTEGVTLDPMAAARPVG